MNVLKVSILTLVTLISCLPLADNAGEPATDPDGLLLARLAERALPFHPEPVHIQPVAVKDAPDFGSIRDSRSRKQAFYDYLLPMVHKANEEVAAERDWLISLAEQLVEGEALHDGQLEHLARVEQRYSLKGTTEDVARVARLLRRVDVVPASLVLAQAAKESGWGTSRFARMANNYFGIWCFYEGCGVTPLSRTEGLSHEVATFASVEESVRYYVRTLNTHSAYQGMRTLRTEARKEGNLSGELLAAGLLRYSERGEAYVREIQAMIRYNRLHRFNRAYAA